MEYKTMLYLQKCLYFNSYLYITWVTVVGFFLYAKVNKIQPNKVASYMKKKYI